jgi:lipid II:glycine glycyltransferase (peptidoglycan interpeptide bridge formation enzyme)
MTIAYVPHGPETAALSAAGGSQAGGKNPAASDVPAGPATLATIGSELSRQTSPHPTFIRFDLPQEGPRGETPGAEGGRPDGLRAGDLCFEELRNQGLRRAPVDVQPPSTVLIDLDPEEEEILAGMKSKTRYNVRLAGKRGVSVREGVVRPRGDDDLSRWYGLYRETAARDRIAIHAEAYYRALFETAALFPDVDLSLLVAEHEGDFLAGIIVLRYGEAATYVYGASSNHKRNLMAPYGLQWEAMRRAKISGARRYDLFGIPPADDPAHPMHGLYRFKTGFGGRIVHRLGAWDYPVSRGAYALYRGAEAARNTYYKRIRKR